MRTFSFNRVSDQDNLLQQQSRLLPSRAQYEPLIDVRSHQHTGMLGHRKAPSTPHNVKPPILQASPHSYYRTRYAVVKKKMSKKQLIRPYPSTRTLRPCSGQTLKVFDILRYLLYLPLQGFGDYCRVSGAVFSARRAMVRALGRQPVSAQRNGACADVVGTGPELKQISPAVSYRAA